MRIRRSACKNVIDAATELGPGVSLLFRVVVMQIVAAHFAAGKHVVLAPIDDVEADAKSLHRCRGGSPQIVRRPFAVSATGQYQRVVVPAILESLSVLELHLTVAHLLGDRFQIDMPVCLASREAPWTLRITRTGELVKSLERPQGEI